MADFNRRMLIGCAGAVGVVVALRWLGEENVGASGAFEIEKSDSEWRRILTRPQYDVLRLHRTEIPGTSPLNNEHRNGVFACVGCDLLLFSSDAKYDSHTGWPSFWRPVENALGMSTGYALLVIPQTEVHCRRCGGHLGHRFDDGPKPTGHRYCINGVALQFMPA